MEYPPISNLLNATFEGLQNKNELANTQKVSPQAPQPVANSTSVGQSEALGAGSSAVSSTNRVGTVLDTFA